MIFCFKRKLLDNVGLLYLSVHHQHLIFPYISSSSSLFFFIFNIIFIYSTSCSYKSRKKESFIFKTFIFNQTQKKKNFIKRDRKSKFYFTTFIKSKPKQTNIKRLKSPKSSSSSSTRFRFFIKQFSSQQQHHNCPF